MDAGTDPNQIELPLTDAERQDIDNRLAEIQRNPHDKLSWDEFRAMIPDAKESSWEEVETRIREMLNSLKRSS